MQGGSSGIQASHRGRDVRHDDRRAWLGQQRCAAPLSLVFFLSPPNPIASLLLDLSTVDNGNFRSWLSRR